MNNNQNNNQNIKKDNKTIKKNREEAKTSIMNLEKLKLEYSLQLNAYKQAIADYINYLQQNAAQPCLSYSADTTGISQACYSDIWQKAGCGSGTIGYPSASASWQQSQTLNGLIQDSWYWATETDSEHRDGCYGSNNTNYNTSTAPDFNINAPPMTTMRGKAFWGSGQTGNPSVTTGGTVEQCQALCSSTTNCSGATYNPTAYAQPMCWLRSGDTDITGGKDSDYAIVPKGKQMLMIVQKINLRLSEINQQIQKITKNGQETYDSQTPERKTNMAELARQYIQLNEEREKIDNTINDYQTLDQQQIQGDLTANKNYYSFVLLLLLAIITIFVLYKVGFSFNSETNSSVLSGGAKRLKTIMSFRNK